MYCPECHALCREEDIFCRQCGADIAVPTTSMTTTHSRLPAVLQNPRLPRSVAASVGALVFGMAIELLRRGLLARLAQPTVSSVEQATPVLQGVKEMLFPAEKRKKRLKKGYEVEETLIYTRRVTHR